jgi:hypothetical protein
MWHKIHDPAQKAKNGNEVKSSLVWHLDDTKKYKGGFTADELYTISQAPDDYRHLLIGSGTLPLSYPRLSCKYLYRLNRPYTRGDNPKTSK